MRATEAAAPRQRGAALLVLMLVVVIAGLAVLGRGVSRRVGDDSIDHRSMTAMAAAKDALIGYAATHVDRMPGEYAFLPCPDTGTTGDEGLEDAANCGAANRNVIGRLPWKTLGLPPMPGGHHECLWLAVSGAYKNGSNKTAMLNADTRGQFEVFAADAGFYLAGPIPGDRAVAVLFAPGAVRTGQNRAPLGSSVEHCGGNYNVAAYLDADGGIDNATVTNSPDAIDQFINGAEPGANDRILTITRRELEDAYFARSDAGPALIAMATAVAECIADYGRKNPAGVTDTRLPWPAPVNLTDYRVNAEYNDSPVGILSGRVPDTVNDSNTHTNNPITNVLVNCDSAAVPTWTATTALLWSQWKDHLFYAVSDSFKPDAPTPNACGGCLSVDGTATLAGIVLLAGRALDVLGQVRDASPLDPDTRDDIRNYLEGRNASNHPDTTGTADYETATASSSFNDVLVCIDDDLSVFPCTDAAGH
ncbi:MAG: hypothetical protein ACN4GT_13070 [Gammaproteobacteria bacterium]